MKKLIKFSDIPEDIDEYYDLDDILYQGSYDFDTAMIENGYFEYGGTRRSHRCITDKFKNCNYNDFVKDLTGIENVQEFIKKQTEEKELKTLFDLAKKYNFQVTPLFD